MFNSLINAIAQFWTFEWIYNSHLAINGTTIWLFIIFPCISELVWQCNKLPDHSYKIRIIFIYLSSTHLIVLLAVH